MPTFTKHQESVLKDRKVFKARAAALRQESEKAAAAQCHISCVLRNKYGLIKKHFPGSGKSLNRSPEMRDSRITMSFWS